MYMSGLVCWGFNSKAKGQDKSLYVRFFFNIIERGTTLLGLVIVTHMESLIVTNLRHHWLTVPDLLEPSLHD